MQTKCPLIKNKSNRIRLALMQEQLKCAKLEKDIFNIFNQNEDKAASSIKLFWELKKSFTSNPKLV